MESRPQIIKRLIVHSAMAAIIFIALGAAWFSQIQSSIYPIITTLGAVLCFIMTIFCLYLMIINIKRLK